MAHEAPQKPFSDIHRKGNSVIATLLHCQPWREIVMIGPTTAKTCSSQYGSASGLK